jgi:hypothetical protein
MTETSRALPNAFLLAPNTCIGNRNCYKLETTLPQGNASDTMSSRKPSKSPHGGHRRRHTSKFPPQDYTDFTRTDISLIAPLLLPQPVNETRSAYEKRIKKGIAALPPHLHCKLSLLSSFCSLHSKLTPGPIISLFNSLREEIEDDVPKTWGPLVQREQLSSQKREMVEIVQHLAVLWLGPKVFQARFEREPRRTLLKEKPTKCCACTLVAMAGDFQTQVAMAGLFIGRVNQNMWENSKRIVWFLEWTSARLPRSRREDAKSLIWEIGKKFRMTRLGAEGAGRSKKKPNLEAEEESELGPGTASYAFSLDRELREERSRGPRKLIGSEAQKDDDHRRRTAKSYATGDDARISTVQQSVYGDDQSNHYYGNDDQDDRRWQQASSFYSRTTSGELPPSISIDDDVMGILSMYDGSHVGEDNAEDEGQHFMPNQPVDDDEESRASGQYNMTPSLIQSMLDHSFGTTWDGSPIGRG